MKRQQTLTSFYRGKTNFDSSARRRNVTRIDEPELVDIIAKMLKVLSEKMERLNVSDSYLYEPFIYFNDESEEGIRNTLKLFGSTPSERNERDQYVKDFIVAVNEAHDYLDAKASVH